ncbi:SAVED domain-containing protein [Haliangium sp. UPWRP_2]|uniref:SAVED domain-containing protein n=1 Tax=Haliangium sp. UPWRP_2 TaxID=1931276 RepID=UPI000B545879|nr:SAVED domain-containing protein [Haliangium sp. UPWRP_2]PSM32295.1 hypothetical protein BVG81_000860 [Haliangium sp. UPWRP_2]
MSYRNQAVVLLNLDAEIARADLLPQLPSQVAERIFFSIKDYDPPPIERLRSNDATMDWWGLGSSIQNLLAALPRTQQERPVDYHLAGRAPLSVFAMLGMELSAWQGPQSLYNPDKDNRWHRMTVGIGEKPASTETPFFDVQPALDRQHEAPGWVALCISRRGGPIDRGLIRRALHRELAGIEELATSRPKTVTEENAPLIAAEIRSVLDRLKTAYPQMSGLALFIEGAMQLAFLCGRQVNPKVFYAVRLYEFRGNRYELAFQLPWGTAPTRQVDPSPEADLRRRQTLSLILGGFDRLKRTLTPDDLPARFPGVHENAPQSREARAHQLLERLRSLKWEPEPAGHDFRLSVLRDHVQLGDGLLEALVHLPEEQQVRIGQLVLLHELLHFDQGLYHSNFHDIGRSGVALEEVDYIADVFSLETLSRWLLRCTSEAPSPGSQSGPTNPIAAITCGLITAALRGMQAFDVMEQGAYLHRLSERRLRRYLIWHFQLARADSLRSVPDLARLFGRSVVLELAPLDGFLDKDFDKHVRQTLPNRTQLVIVCEDTVRRFSHHERLLNLDVLLTSLRTFAHDVVQSAMRHVVEAEHHSFIPWRP